MDVSTAHLLRMEGFRYDVGEKRKRNEPNENIGRCIMTNFAACREALLNSVDKLIETRNDPGYVGKGVVCLVPCMYLD